MKIYDEITKEELTEESCDPEKGYLYIDRIKTGHVDTTYEIMEDSISDLWPNGMQREIPAHDIYEECQYYHAYTEAEIAEREEADKNAAEAAEREANINRITEIDAQITYTAMMTNTLLTEDEDSDHSSDSSENETDNSVTEEDESNE